MGERGNARRGGEEERGGVGEVERRRNRRRRYSYLEKQVKILVPLISNFCKCFIGNCRQLSKMLCCYLLTAGIASCL